MVADARFFELNATLTLRRGDLRAGRYVLRRDMSNGQAIEALMQGPKVRVVKTFDVTHPRGPHPARDGAARARGRRRRPLPAGHLVARDAAARAPPRRAHGARARPRASSSPPPTSCASARTRAALVDRQLDAFQQNFGSLDLRYARRRNLTRYDVVTIASMVEREAQLDRERPLIAAVIYNRLKLGMPLGIDATIRYVENNWSRPLLQSELDRDTPYNTRLHTGLPPTPIGNPGLASLQGRRPPRERRPPLLRREARHVRRARLLEHGRAAPARRRALRGGARGQRRALAGHVLTER